MNLVVFDIDGTLVKYHPKRNDRAYVRAVREIFGLTIEDSWSEYVQSTDSGILNEIAQKQKGRNASKEERSRFKKSMAKWLEAEYGDEPFESHAGAKPLWDQLLNHRDWKTVVGTGNWEFSARFKLKSAGLEIGSAPLGSADDGNTREKILRSSLQKAGTHYKIPRFDKIVYVGDWIWDVRAAKALGWKFIGIAQGEEAKTLREAGAEMILPDFEGLLPYLDKA
jgi:phosphoglycolate phosphatase-like HAD superfamily hydrolase